MNASMQTDQTRKDHVDCFIKLFAVRDKDQKLIGVVSFEVDWQSSTGILLDDKVLSFSKCIDPSATITLSARLIEGGPRTMTHEAVSDYAEISGQASRTALLAKRQIPRPERLYVNMSGIIN